jgi:hypothetical protein
LKILILPLSLSCIYKNVKDTENEVNLALCK